MFVKPEQIKTEVDLLINLLKNVKEISMADAGREIGVPTATIEAWSNFLEEEGVLSLKYKLTTPYLVYKEKEEKQKEGLKIPVKLFEDRPALDETQKEINELDELLSRAYTQAKSGEFGMAKQSYPVVVDRFKKLRERVFSMLKGEPLRDFFKKEIDDIESLLEVAKKHTEEKKFDLANSLYTEIYQKLKTLLVHVRKSYDEQPKAAEKAEKIILPRELKVSDLKVLLDAAYKYIREERFDEARNIYEKLNSMYYGLPREFSQRKSEIEHDLVKLNKDLSLNMDSFAKKRMGEGSQKIKGLLVKADSYAKRGLYPDAMGLYYNIKELFEGLPEGFQKEKNELKSGILRLYDLISNGWQRALTEEMNSKSRAIVIFLNETSEAVKNNRISEAGQKYDKVKRIYETLPSGFVSEKAELQERIISVYELLSTKYKEAYNKSLMENAAKINSLIKEMQQKIRNNDIGPSESIYKEIKQLYTGLPEGFLREKTDLQGKIVKVYEELAAKSEAMASRDFLSKLSEINKLILDAENLIKKKEFDMADEIYPEIVSAFSLLPEGFLEKKIELRNRILALYRDVMLNMDSPFLKWYGEDVNEKYKEVLKQIIRAHRAIEREDFGILEVIYIQVRKMFEELPIGFVKQKMRLREDADKLYREIMLLKVIPKMEELAKAGNFDALGKLLESAQAEEHKLLAECPEDGQLFNFLEMKFADYHGVIRKDEERLLLSKRKIDFSSKRKEAIEKFAPSPLKQENAPEEPRITISTLSVPERIPKPASIPTEEDYSRINEKAEQLKKLAAPKLKAFNF